MLRSLSFTKVEVKLIIRWNLSLFRWLVSWLSLRDAALLLSSLIGIKATESVIKGECFALRLGLLHPRLLRAATPVLLLDLRIHLSLQSQLPLIHGNTVSNNDSLWLRAASLESSTFLDIASEASPTGLIPIL